MILTKLAYFDIFYNIPQSVLFSFVFYSDNDKHQCEGESPYVFLQEDMILTPPCSPSPDELLLPCSLRGHEQRLFSSPDDMQAARSHQDDPTISSYSRNETTKGKTKSSSLPRTSQSCHFPSSPKIARCDDDVAEELNRQGIHSRQSSEDDDLWMEQLHPQRALSPRHIRGLSNEKQVFTPSSPNSQRRIACPVSPLATRPPERQLSSPATCTEGGFLSPKSDQTTYAMRFTSRSPRLVRRQATDMDTCQDLDREGNLHPVWVPNSETGDKVSPEGAMDSSGDWSSNSPTYINTAPPRVNRVPIAAMEDLEVDSASDKSPSPEQDKQREKWKHKWKVVQDPNPMDVGQETLV